jgi:hypothetical protein
MRHTLRFCCASDSLCEGAFQGITLMEEYIPAKISDVRREHGSPADYDYKNVAIVASAWLLFYVLMLSGLLSNQDRDLLASISDVLAQN